MFGNEQKQSTGVVSPVNMRFDWKTNKKLLDQIKATELAISDKSTTPEEKAIFQKKLDGLKQEKPYGFVMRIKDLEQEQVVIPDELLLLDEVSCMKGFDKKNRCHIYSNEIKYFNKEKFVVVSRKAGKIYENFYGKSTKDEFKNRGLTFTKGIIVQEGDSINEYYVNGTAISIFNYFVNGLSLKDDLANSLDLHTPVKIDTNIYKIKFDGAIEIKNGDVIYYAPKRTQGSEITDNEREVAMASVELLNDYYIAKNGVEIDFTGPDLDGDE